MFAKMDKSAYPARQWALYSFPGAGKSTFSTQMRAPILPIDADHRYAEVAYLVKGDVFELSQQASDLTNAERIARLLKEGMPGSGVKTIVIDSLTSILTPLVVEAILGNDGGRNTNRVAAFKPKALALRLLQDNITSWGVDTLWIYHVRSGLDNKAVAQEATTISPVELARLRRSLNMQLRVIQQDNRRGIYIEWARGGRDKITLWDDSGTWVGMPEKIEQAAYAGLNAEQRAELENAEPTEFANQADAIAWGWDQGVFRDAVHAANAYEKLKTANNVQTANEMWRLWIADVKQRMIEKGAEQ